MPTINVTITQDPQILAPLTNVVPGVEQDVVFTKQYSGECVLVIRPNSDLHVKTTPGGPEIHVAAGGRLNLPLRQPVTTLYFEGDAKIVSLVSLGVGIDLAPADTGSNATTPVIDCSFTKSGAGIIADEVQPIGPVGPGMAAQQQYSNLLIDTGTNPGAETLIRSIGAFSGAHVARARISRTQPIVNQHVVTMLADLIGEGLPFVVDATGLLITVTLPAGHGFTAENIGQSMMLGGAQGAALSHPGRYPIVAVSGNNITFSPVFDCTWTRSTGTATASFMGGAPIFSVAEAATVSDSSDTAAIPNGVVSIASQTNVSNNAAATFTCNNTASTSGTLKLTFHAKAWTPSATGTLTLYGWNYSAFIRNGISHTAGWKDTQRKGWSSGAATMTKTTDLAPLGVIDQWYGDCQLEAFSDASPASQSTGLMFNQRGTAIDSLPPKETNLYFFMSVHNGVVAPASTTRVGCGFFRMFDIGILKVQISGFDQTGYPSIADVRVTSLPTGNVTLTGSSPTLNTESSTNLGASATYTGASRDGGSTAANQRFAARFYADQSGTARIEMSTDGSTWRRATADIAVTAAVPVSISVDAVTRYHRCIFVNGATPQGAFLAASAYFKV